MRKGWKYKKLGEVATYINGYAFKPDQWKESGTPIVRIQNLNNENAPYNYYDGEVPDKVKIQNGDLLISWSASLGAYIWHGGNAFLNQHIFKVAFDKTDIDKFFLKYAVTSKLAAMAEQVHGATMKHIVKKDFDNTQIPYPPLSTQLAIVSELDKINELIRLKKEQLKDFDNLAQSLFYEMFGDPVENEKGWEVKKIKDIAKYYNGVAHEQDVDKDGDFVLINAKFISSEGQIKKYSSIQRFPLLKNDIVMVLSDLPNGKSLAKCFLIDEDNKYTLNQRICCFRGFEGSSVYLKNIINRNPYLLSFDNGKGQTNLRKGDVEKLPIPLPPIPLQRLFAQRIEQIEREKSEVQKSIQDLETLLASRMQYWFE